jgi:hypothetical protein
MDVMMGVITMIDVIIALPLSLTTVGTVVGVAVSLKTHG